MQVNTFNFRNYIILSLLCLGLSMPNIVYAELSELSKSRIQKAAVHCQEVNNELTYKDYWKDSVKPENMQTACLAEKYSDQVADDGGFWLQVNSDTLMQECKQKTQKDRNMYFLCLKQSLLEKAHELSEPCVELEEEKLWDEKNCRHLVSYIFVKNFEDRMPESEKTDSRTNITELSMISSFRIKQARAHCEKTNNELVYKEYWGKSVKSESMNTVCIAEQFADQVAADGYQWLNKKAVPLIEQCKLQGKKDKRIYSFCLQKNLQQITKILSAPCAEMGEKNLWDEQNCRRLVSYIFVLNFEEVLEENMPFFEKLSNSFDKFSRNTLVKIIFNPITAILILIIFVMDIVMLITPGDWSQVSKLSFILGPLILLASFLQGGMRVLFSGIVVITLLLMIFWNHNKSLFESKKKSNSVKIID